MGHHVDHSNASVNISASVCVCVCGGGGHSLATRGMCVKVSGGSGGEGGPGGVGWPHPSGEGRLLAGLGWPGGRQMREKRKQAVGGVLPDCSGRCWEEWLVCLRKSRLQLREWRPQTSLLLEGPISKVPAIQYQVGTAPNREPRDWTLAPSTLLKQSEGLGQNLQATPPIPHVLGRTPPLSHARLHLSV